MAEIKNRDRILEAIDQLRRRKARPNMHRIATYLFRRYSVSNAEAKADLQKCVVQEIVLEVQYKGNTSYRNAAKKSSVKRASSTGDNPSTSAPKTYVKFVQLLTNAFGELMLQEPDYIQLGVPAQEIIDNILAQDRARYNANYISILLEREVANGFITKLPNNNYLMGSLKEDVPGMKVTKTTTTDDSGIAANMNDHNNKTSSNNNTEDEDESATTPNNTIFSTYETIISDGKKPNVKKTSGSTSYSCEKKRTMVHHLVENGNSGNLRVGGRRKRAKKVFDPSDTHIPKKRGRPAGSLNKSTIEKQLARLSDESRPDSRTSNGGSRDQGGVCSVCHIQNKRGPNDRMVACRECSNKAHYSCLHGDDMMLRMYPDNTWQCPHCKTCVVCYETSDAGSLIVCNVCTDPYHTTCHQPRIPENKIKSNSKWLCMHCETPDELKINEIQSNMTNMTNSFSNKSNSVIESNDNLPSSPSLSGNTTPNDRSPSISPTPPQLSPQNELPQNGDGNVSDSQSSKDYDDDNIDPSIPDATHWTCEEVYQYFAQYFPKEAKVFREQEIDGRALLIMRRIDVLTTLNLKLGPALKIYRHVVKLQVRRDDPKLYWL